MKIGILTFIHTRNFGANLQCFALQHQLSLMGYDSEVINLYRPDDKGYLPCEDDKKRFPKLYSYHSLKDYRKRINKFIASVIRRLKTDKSSFDSDGFTSFRNEFIHFSSEEYRNFTQLYNGFPQSKYTHLIVGSDQVWNYASGFSKEPFFLTFADKVKKIAYAPSLGHTNIPSPVKEIYKNWLSDFNSISVREESASIIFSDLLNQNIPFVLDPTLLLNREQWVKAFNISDDTKESIILVYMLSVSTDVMNFANDLAKKLGCKVKIITSRPVLGNHENCEILRNENPKSFIELFNRAKFVVTNSFHGTAFAINFNIPFVTIDKINNRLVTRKLSLLKLLCVEHRHLYEGEKIVVDDYIKCDFSETNRILQQERVKSFKFLTESLNS